MTDTMREFEAWWENTTGDYDLGDWTKRIAWSAWQAKPLFTQEQEAELVEVVARALVEDFRGDCVNTEDSERMSKAALEAIKQHMGK